MKSYKRIDKGKIEKIKKIADKNICVRGKFHSEDFTYVFEEEGAICTFLLQTNNGFESPLLKSCYYLSLTFLGTTMDGKKYLQPFNHKIADKIIKKFFPETKSVWEHAQFTRTGSTAYTQHYCLFVSITSGKKTITLRPQDMQELLTNNYVLCKAERQ